MKPLLAASLNPLLWIISRMLQDLKKGLQINFLLSNFFQLCARSSGYTPGPDENAGSLQPDSSKQ
jgi:hypothetical protein